jgi:nitrite reductase (NADH) small subunit
MTVVLEKVSEVCVGNLDQIPVGEGRTFRIAGEEIAVFRGRNGKLYAVENRCPHRGGPLSEGVFGGEQVICPYHSYRFQLSNGTCLTDGSCRLRTFRVWEEDGLLFLRIG